MRIRGNSIRLRLSQEEVKQLATSGHVGQSIQFGPEESQQLHYEIITQDGNAGIHAEFSGHEISVFIPRSQAKAWAETDEVSLSQHQLISSQESLQILIEKDFKCMIDRPDEDESDLYPNPKSEETAESSVS